MPYLQVLATPLKGFLQNTHIRDTTYKIPSPVRFQEDETKKFVFLQRHPTHFADVKHDNYRWNNQLLPMVHAL